MSRGNYRNRVRVIKQEQSLGDKPIEALREETEALIQHMIDEGWTYRGLGGSWGGNQRAIMFLVFVRKELQKR